MIKDYCFNLNGILMPEVKNDCRELDPIPCKTVFKLKLLYRALAQELPAGPRLFMTDSS